MCIFDIGRRRHKIKDSIQELLNTDVLVSRTADDRECLALAGSLAENLLHIVNRRLISFKILLHKFIVEIADLLNHLGVIVFRRLLQIIWNLDLLYVFAMIAFKKISLHLKEINDALELVLGANRIFDHDGVFLKLIADLVNSVQIVRTDNIHLVDECNSGNIESVCLMPYVLRLRLDAFLRTEDTDCAVKNAE